MGSEGGLAGQAWQPGEPWQAGMTMKTGGKSQRARFWKRTQAKKASTI